MLRVLEDGLMRFEILFFDELSGEDINEICRVFNEAFFLARGALPRYLEVGESGWADMEFGGVWLLS